MRDVYTIGYQGITLAHLKKLMRENGIDLIVDVRSRPWSRFGYQEFNRKNLEEKLRGKYQWWGDRLGGFGCRITKKAIADLDALAQEKTVCLMCFENDPDDCHRYRKIGVKLEALGRELAHIFD